jgi:glycerophosphoryl diester phosphodiesterase
LVELTLTDLLSRFGLGRPTSGPQQVRVMSFAASSLRRVHALAPGVPTVYLMTRVPVRLRDGALPAGSFAVGPSLRALRAVPHYVERVHEHGGAVHVWTVDAPADVDYVRGLGVDAIITNRPSAVLAQLVAARSD